MLNYIQFIVALFSARYGKREQGFALLEYCAGAAIVAGIVWGAMQVLGTNLSNFLTALGAWAQDRAGDI